MTLQSICVSSSGDHTVVCGMAPGQFMCSAIVLEQCTLKMQFQVMKASGVSNIREAGVIALL